MVDMVARPRVYDTILRDHLARRRQMAFVSGPRQVGKTTTCRALGSAYLDWDDADHRKVILSGPAAVAAHAGLSIAREQRAVVVFDELHEFRRWKSFLKGFFDTYGADVRVLVTGSSRMDLYRRGSDSLMGRYFPYRMHPFSVAEVAATDLPDLHRILRPPRRLAEGEFEALWEHGGYPEPFLTREARFTQRWASLRREQLVRGDVRDMTRVSEIAQIETLAHLLEAGTSAQLVYRRLADAVQVSVDTARRWVGLLAAFHLGFLVRPWFKKVSRSLRKEPKWYLRDWAGVTDPGARAETFVACHLLKAVEGWEDLGLGEFHLGYLRDKEKHEVDFVVVRDGKPWFLVEAKRGDEGLSPALAFFQERLRAPFAFQVVLEAPYVDVDCFARPGGPLVVPARTFLSQLL